jgi:carbon monoxide dehydrogenase subunit G
MHLTGNHSFTAPLQTVWDTLLSPEVISQCMPGCEKFDQIGPDQYEATMRIGIGPIKGTYSGKIRLADQQPPSQYRMEVDGGGAPGHVTGGGAMVLREENGKVVVSYDGDAQVTGKIASVGQRLLTPIAKQMINQFFKCMESKIGNRQ